MYIKELGGLARLAWLGGSVGLPVHASDEGTEKTDYGPAGQADQKRATLKLPETSYYERFLQLKLPSFVNLHSQQCLPRKFNNANFLQY